MLRLIKFLWQLSIKYLNLKNLIDFFRKESLLRNLKTRLGNLKKENFVCFAYSFEIKAEKKENIIEQILKYKIKEVSKKLDIFLILCDKKEVELRDIAGKCNVEIPAKKNKPEIIKDILKQPEYKKIAKILGISWWKRNKEDVYGITTMIGFIMRIKG